MKLTGQAEIDFEKWAMINATFIYDYAIENDDKTGIPTDEGRYFHYQDIDDFPNSFKFGVYVDFFDSVAIHITLEQLNFQTWYSYRIVHLCNEYKNVQLNRRHEARTEAIKKAVEIYNQR